MQTSGNMGSPTKKKYIIHTIIKNFNLKWYSLCFNRRGILVQYFMNGRCQTPFELKVETQISEEEKIFFLLLLNAVGACLMPRRKEVHRSVYKKIDWRSWWDKSWWWWCIQMVGWGNNGRERVWVSRLNNRAKQGKPHKTLKRSIWQHGIAKNIQHIAPEHTKYPQPKRTTPWKLGWAILMTEALRIAQLRIA